MGIKFLDRTTGEINYFNEGNVEEFINFGKFCDYINYTKDEYLVLETLIFNRVKIEICKRRNNVGLRVSYNIGDLNADEWIIEENWRNMYPFVGTNSSFEEIKRSFVQEIKSIKLYWVANTKKGEIPFRELFENDEITFQKKEENIIWNYKPFTETYAPINIETIRVTGDRDASRQHVRRVTSDYFNELYNSCWSTVAEGSLSNATSATISSASASNTNDTYISNTASSIFEF
jgi:hypothetical protein